MAEAGVLGKPLRRREDPQFLVGNARFLADLAIPGILEVAFVRSPYAHARLIRVDVTPALAAPGVVTAVTGTDLRAEVLPLEAGALNPSTCTTPWPALPTDRVLFSGQAVAAVVATNRYLAEDAAERVVVENELLPPVVTISDALAPDAPRLHPHLRDQVLGRFEGGAGDPQAVGLAAPLRFSLRFKSNRQSAAPIEGRGCVAVPNPATGKITLYTSHQAPFLMRLTLARCLGIHESRVRVVVPNVGGAFGGKLSAYPEELVVTWLAQRLRKPLRWVEDRRENFMSMTHSREGEYEVHCAADSDGRLIAAELKVRSNVGAYSAYPYGAIQEPSRAAKAFPGPYALRHYRYDTMAVATNKVPSGPYRGISAPISTCVMEMVMEEISRLTGLDPAEVRRRNLIPHDRFPYRTAAGITHGSGNWHELLDRAMVLVDYPAIRRAQPQWWAQGRYVGVGLTALAELNSPGPEQFQERGSGYYPSYERAVLRAESDGTVTVMVGTSCQGQGHWTTLAQIVAHELGLEVEAVNVLFHDTAIGPLGFGAFASRTTVLAGSACQLAAARLRDQVIQVASHLLEVHPRDLECANGLVRVRGTDRGLALTEVFRVANMEPHRLPPNVEPGLTATAAFTGTGTTASGSVHAAVVEVDIETGLIKILQYAVAEDCGRRVNPLILSGQTVGAVAQGLGGALLEDLTYDGNGQLLTASLMDYLLPTAVDVPRIVNAHLETMSPTPGGFKGMAEGGTIGASAAVVIAVMDALRPLGIRPDRLPLSPSYLWKLVQAAKGQPQDPA